MGITRVYANSCNDSSNVSQQRINQNTTGISSYQKLFEEVKGHCHGDENSLNYQRHFDGNNMSYEKDLSVHNTEKEETSSTSIVVKPDGSRVLMVTTQIGGMQTTMSLKISDPTDMSNSSNSPVGSEMEETAQGNDIVDTGRAD